MATKSMKKVEPVEPIVETTEVSNAAVTVNADDLIKSILNNVGTEQRNGHNKEYVLCRSVTNGGLNINCKSGNVYEFSKYGSDCEIEYHDLVALVRKHSDHIFNPRIVIEDESFVNEFPQLSKVYEKLYTEEDINAILNLSPNRMKEEIAAMPQAVYENLKSLVATKIASGEIDSVRTIRALSEVYDSDFNLLSELFSK